jgi:dTDP-4-dehydrorhamnose 3,5-epimerase
MQIETTSLPGLLILKPSRFGDDRGWFSETWNQSKLAEQGVHVPFVQDNHSMSSQPNTVRGLHFQRPPRAQDKLVRCTRGAVYDVAVDARRGSPTYGQWFGIDLTPDNGLQLLVPKGFLHGFVTRLPDSELQYKCSDIYAQDCDGAIRWDDPSIGIDWSLTGAPVLSAKDERAPLFRDFDTPFHYEG